MGNLRKQKQTKTRKKIPVWILPAVIGLLVIAGLFGTAGELNLSLADKLGSTDTPSPSKGGRKSPTDDPGKAAMRVLIKNTRHFKGSPDAPVTILEFSDFQ